jgi:3-hydroxybutyryl-CoA dehydrogenase
VGYKFPEDAGQRPIAVDGAGTLGRRIATVFAAGGTDARIFDLSEEQRGAAQAYADANLEEFRQALGTTGSKPGAVMTVGTLEEAVADAWLVVEAVPERPDLKMKVFGELDRIAPPDAILASNSSSIPTSQVIGEVEHRERVLNMHFQMPPELTSVELMSCGETDDAAIDALMETMPRYGIVPFRVRRESDGFIFNRIWAAIKRECLMVLEEGVASAEDVDKMWEIFTRPGVPPFRLMDRVGLDVVLAIEEHYAAVRPGLPEGPRQLLRDYIDQGHLGVKSGEGFYRYDG